MWAKIITIKRTKDLNYFSLCALNLFNTRVSQFELNYWNKWTFFLLRCTCIWKWGEKYKTRFPFELIFFSDRIGRYFFVNKFIVLYFKQDKNTE